MTFAKTLHDVMPAGMRGIVERLAAWRHRKWPGTISAYDRALIERQRAALKRSTGILKDVDIPEWETPEKTSAWVRKLRHGCPDVERPDSAEHP